MHSYTVEPLYVNSGKDVIAADFYRPKTEHKPAVIIMAHGLAALRQFKLVQYAKRFAQAGYAVVLFDYRYWGGSTGRPRELVLIQAQLEDWRTMIAHILERKSVDTRRIVLWGTSLSGGYVLTLAAELKNVHAVIAQIPFVDGAESAKLYPLQQLPKALKISSQDYMGAKVGMAPKTLPVVDRKGLSFMPTADSYAGYLSIVNPDYFWSGEIPARIFFNLIRYRPIQDVRKISVPVLFIAAKQDSLVPLESSRETATNIAPYVQYHEWDMQHFDIYHGQWFEKAISTQLEFLHQHIGVS
ncbi:alpha/beta fold hydrolase [Acinetobacter sp. ANC 4779]|uniref:alpha/beta hydrolase n=1 Tax=Acinetobacter sp. ANC 4779 TaxID=2529848 RepID=UPI00103EACD2|nr:alpha/beta fold hydrolase [Acinetobacter sp. ANC 4779]TCB49918.1 alpha/beta fold hydrolase [Acinetobacter sp. ANC 4779]